MIDVSEIDSQTSMLIGFAIKSRQIVRGYEGVIQAMKRNRLLMVIVQRQISPHTLKKMEKFEHKDYLPIIRTGSKVNWDKMWGLQSHRIFGIMQGNLGRKILQNFKAGA